MQLRDHLPWHGRVRITSRSADGRVEVDELENLITDAGRNLLRDALNGTVSDCQIRYVALGSGNTAPSRGDVKLGSERIRKQATKRQAGAAGVLTTTLYVAPFDANDFTIQEIGWFAGVGATGAKDSGVLVARVLYTRAKNQLESIQIDRIDTLG